MYKIRYIENGLNMILRLEDNAWIPEDEANSDYREYLVWLDEGNKPEVFEL